MPVPSLVRAVAQAKTWYDRITKGEVRTMRELAKRTGFNDSYVSRVLDLAVLSPEIPASPDDQKTRTKHFPHLRTPSPFVHETRDGFGSIDELATSVKLIPAYTELLSISGAGHELMTRRNRDELPGFVVEAFRPFCT